MREEVEYTTKILKNGATIRRRTTPKPYKTKSEAKVYKRKRQAARLNSLKG